MKITRHTAPDMRQALRAVREQLGADAVILTSRRTPQGVEVTAAMDFDAETMAGAGAAPATAAIATSPAAVPFLAAPAVTEQQPPEQQPLEQRTPELAWPASLSTAAEIAPAALGDPAAPGIASATAASVSALENELKTLRRMLETQLAQLAWKDLTQRAPIHTEILRELTEVGIAPDLAAEAVAHVPPGAELTQARRLTIASIAQRLLVTGDRWMQEGGTIALVGATGVGKTTTLAKLAVRWVLQHGPRDLTLIAADALRIGAQDQVQSLGQLLGTQVYSLADFAELPALLTRLGQRRLVLIDTPGSSQRDAQLALRLAALNAVGPALQTTLVLAASTQAGAVAEAVRHFAPANPTSCVLTKVDEAASLGGILSVLMRARLPISYVSEGQRVPEDLRPARTLELVSSAVQLAQSSGAAADEDLLKRRFGELAHAIA